MSGEEARAVSISWRCSHLRNPGLQFRPQSFHVAIQSPLDGRLHRSVCRTRFTSPVQTHARLSSGPGTPEGAWLRSTAPGATSHSVYEIPPTARSVICLGGKIHPKG